jgi:hypothetical protein
MKLFDRLGRNLYKTVNRVFAETVMAVWVSSNDPIVSYAGPVIFNNITDKETVDTSEFMPSDPYMEFLSPAFTGLKLNVDNSMEEVVTISGNDYHVTSVQQLSDGLICKAYLSLINSAYGPQ